MQLVLWVYDKVTYGEQNIHIYYIILCESIENAIVFSGNSQSKLNTEIGNGDRDRDTLSHNNINSRISDE